MMMIYTVNDVNKIVDVFDEILHETREVNAVWEELQKRLPNYPQNVMLEFINWMKFFSKMTKEYIETNFDLTMRFIAIRMSLVANNNAQ